MKNPKLLILHEDSCIIVCRKPAGIPVQTAKFGQQDLVSLLMNHRAANGEDSYIGTVHRLDQPVEGVMAFAKTKKAAADLSQQTVQKKTEKYYLAAVSGRPECTEGRLENFLVRNGRENLSRTSKPDERGAKYACLSYEVLEYSKQKDASLVRVKLETGRHHQIRVQFSAAGHPLLGDRKYNPDPGGGNVALCASMISFFHPQTGKRVTYRTVPENPHFSGFERAGSPEKEENTV